MPGRQPTEIRELASRVLDGVDPLEAVDELLSEEKWMQKAFKPSHKGRLHHKLGIPEDEKIPKSVLDKAYAKAKAEGDTKTMRQINLARRGREASGADA